MNKQTLTILAIAAATGIGYYLWKNKKPALAPATAKPAKGGGTGANASTSSAFNGVLDAGITAAGKGAIASIGALFGGGGGGGGAKVNPTTTSVGDAVGSNYYEDPGSSGGTDSGSGIDYSTGDYGLS